MANFRHFFHEYFNLMPDKESEAEVIEGIRAGAQFRGANLWVLIFAIFIASLGLNVNSTAVIIGAMLVSPLMGPIIGMGLAVGINDLDLLKTSLKNFAVATVVSILTAMVYFLLSPFKEAQSELLARTSPTLYDVMIAFFGGAAGILALCTKGKGNVIPGVAIATALMPPLCTAGYGLATGQWMFFFGAFYLFFINTVFISLATFLGVRVLSFRTVENVTRERAMKARRVMMGLVILTMVPAAILTFSLVRQSFFKQNVASFIDEQLNWTGTQIISHRVDNKEQVLHVAVIGAEVDSVQQRLAEQQLPNYHLADYRLVVIQGVQSDSLLQRVSRIETSRSDYKNTVLQQSQQIHELEAALNKYESLEELAVEIRPELQVLYPAIQTFTLARTLEVRSDTTSTLPITVALVGTSAARRLTENQIAQLGDWLRARTGADSLRVVMAD